MNDFSGNQRLETSDIFRPVHPVGDNHGKLAGNPGKEHVRLRGGMVAGLPPGDAHVVLKVVDGAFHGGPYLIEGIPFVGIPLDTGEHAEVHVFVSVGGAPLFGGAAGGFAVADPQPFYHVDFRAYPFIAVRTPFFMAVPGIFHVQAAVFGAGGVSVGVVADFLKGAFIPWVIRNECFGEVELILEEAVGLDCVKRGIAKESVRMEGWVQAKEVGEHRL